MDLKILLTIELSKCNETPDAEFIGKKLRKGLPGERVGGQKRKAPEEGEEGRAQRRVKPGLMQSLAPMTDLPKEG